MLTPDEVVTAINAQCPTWLRLHRVMELGNGTRWGAQFQILWNDTFDDMTTISFGSLYELLSEVLEVLPTLSEEKMNIFGTDLFKYISGDMLGDKAVTKTIDHVVLEELSNGKQSEKKPVLYFQDGKKGWVLNKSSARAIADVLGPETNHWKGATVTLKSESMFAFGKQMNVIRVTKVGKQSGGKATPVQEQPDLFDEGDALATTGAYAE